MITSAKVACGFQAGDPTIMRRVCARARERGVAVGAQVSYRDLAGSGGRLKPMPADELSNEIVYQIGGLDACARAEGTVVSYVKPHGALNNVSARDPEQARSIVDAVLAVDAMLPLLILPGSELEVAAVRTGHIIVREAFPYRAYEPDGSLGSRRLPDADLDDVASATQRGVDLACRGTVVAHDGTELSIKPHALCPHGDNDSAVEGTQSVSAELRAEGVALNPFTSVP